jgi:hypothetical protein
MIKTTIFNLSGVALAALCLAAVGGTAASAAPLICGCGGTFNTRTDVGLDTPVTGSVTSISDDWFEFQGLTAGALLSEVLTITNTSTGRFAQDIVVTLLTTSDTAITGDNHIDVAPGDTATFTGVVPLNTDVVVEIAGASRTTNSSYSATLSPVPEPGTLSAMGLGLIGIGSMRFLARKNRKTRQS